MRDVLTAKKLSVAAALDGTLKRNKYISFTKANEQENVLMPGQILPPKVLWLVKGMVFTSSGNSIGKAESKISINRRRGIF